MKTAPTLCPAADGGDLGAFWKQLLALKTNPQQYAPQILKMTRVLYRAFECLASGLAFMHQSNIRRKNIKPQNILIHQGRVRYTNFGLSFDWSMFDNRTTKRLTEKTPEYAAPEVLAGASKNSSSAVYSLGCVFITMLAALDGTPH